MDNSNIEAYWRDRIQQWRHTDLSLAAFARRQQLTYHQLTYWKRRFEQLAVAGSTAPVESVSTGFTRVVSRTVEVEEQHESEAALTVVLATGVKISGIHAGNLDLIQRLVRQL